MKTFKITYFDQRNLTKYCYIQAKHTSGAATLFNDQYAGCRFYSATEQR